MPSSPQSLPVCRQATPATRAGSPANGYTAAPNGFPSIPGTCPGSPASEDWLAIALVNDDQDLIAGTLRGETGAFGQLVGRYQNRLFNSLTRMTGSVEDAEDIAQEAFVHAFQKLHTFRGGSRFYSWLFRIALNAAVTLHRKRDKATASVEAVREQVGFEPADPRPNSTPQSPLETSERQALVQLALRDLPEEFRQVLVLREMDEMSYEEIAEIVDCPIGTVRSRIHRARQELRDRLAALLRE